MTFSPPYTPSIASVGKYRDTRVLSFAHDTLLASDPLVFLFLVFISCSSGSFLFMIFSLFVLYPCNHQYSIGFRNSCRSHPCISRYFLFISSSCVSLSQSPLCFSSLSPLTRSFSYLVLLFSHTGAAIFGSVLNSRFASNLRSEFHGNVPAVLNLDNISHEQVAALSAADKPIALKALGESFGEMFFMALYILILPLILSATLKKAHIPEDESDNHNGTTNTSDENATVSGDKDKDRIKRDKGDAQNELELVLLKEEDTTLDNDEVSAQNTKSAQKN